MKKNRLILSIIVLLILLTGILIVSCKKENKSSSTGKSGNVELTVSAAASLQDVMETIKDEYNKENKNIDITFNFASSGSLQQQIEHGAKVDVFISAATKQMDALAEKNLLINDTKKNFLENSVVLIVPKELEVIEDFDDLNSDDVNNIAIGEPESVPAGKYAKETLTSLDLYNKIESKMVFAKDVREVLTWVETGNAEAGIVYASDANSSDSVKIVSTAPKGSHESVYYPASVIKNSDYANESTDFVEFLYSKTVKPIFEEYGFVFIE